MRIDRAERHGRVEISKVQRQHHNAPREKDDAFGIGRKETRHPVPLTAKNFGNCI